MYRLKIQTNLELDWHNSRFLEFDSLDDCVEEDKTRSSQVLFLLLDPFYFIIQIKSYKNKIWVYFYKISYNYYYSCLHIFCV